MTTFNFTGFTEADLLQGTNGSSIGYGDVFTMPGSATTEFSVYDNDGTLSGDYYNNENGDDNTGQTADISVNGVQVFDDVKIYAESYHVLLGSDGKYYYMMEIEVRGSANAPGQGDDFFTFFGDVPPAGVELTVYCQYNVTCDWVDYNCLDSGPVTVENAPPVAVDDSYVTDENTTVQGNVLDNDSDPDGDDISVISVEGGVVGESFSVTTDKGYTGQVTLNADGSFTFDPDENFKALAQGEQDSFTLDYTIADDPSATVKHNLLFVLDISNSTVGAGGGNNIFDGTGVGDVNGDGLADTVLDAEIAGVIAAVNSLIADGVNPADIDIGIVTFSGIASGFANVNAETLGTFALDSSNLMTTLMGIQSGGWTNYEAGLQQAEAWFASQDGDGAKNKLMFLSDGRPIVGHDGSNYITQTNANYGDEVSRIAGNYNADIYAIGVGANSDLDYLNDLDNTGGAERVLDTTSLNAVLENAVASPGESTASITVTINGLNEGPDAVNDAVTIDEDETAAINILSNDSDPDGDAILITQAGGVAVGEVINVTTVGDRSGTVTVASDGSLTFTPGAEFASMNDGDTDSFQISYTITDGQFTDTATVTVTVNGKGHPIDAIDDAYSVGEQEDVAANILDNDIPNDGSVSVTAVAQVANSNTAGGSFNVGDSVVVTTEGGRAGTVTVEADGTFSFDGGDNFVDMMDGDTDSFQLTYTISDGTAQLGENLIINGTFEDHGALTRGSGQNRWDVFDSITGWDTPVHQLEIQQGTHGGTPVNSTTNSVLELDSHDVTDTNATISQTVEVAEAGTFRLSFDYSPRQLGSEIGSTSGVNVIVNGVVIATLASDELGYQNYEFDVEFNAGSNMIGFAGVGTDDTYGALLDNVELRGVTTISDTATVTVVVNGEGVPVTTREIDLFGNIETEGEGSRALAIVVDTSFIALSTVSGATAANLNGDARLNTVVDLFLSKVVDLAHTLDADQEIALIPAGQDSAGPAVILTAGQIVAATPDWATDQSATPEVQALFAGITDDLTDNTIDLDKGLLAAESYLNTEGADANQVMVLTTTDGYDAGQQVLVSDPTETFNRITDDAGLDAEVDVVLIENGGFALLDDLNAIDSDGLADDITSNPAFGLDSILEDAPTVSAGNVLEITVNGQTFPVTDEDPSADGFQWSELDFEIEIGTQPTVLVGLDQDGDGLISASEQIDVSSLLVESGDTFSFDFNALEDLLA